MWTGRGEMGDILRQRMLGTDRGHAHVGGFPGFREGVVAGVEILAFLMAVPLMVSQDATLVRIMRQMSEIARLEY